MEKVRTILLNRSAYADNDLEADALREYLKDHNTFVVNLMSSPGAGKTSTLIKLINLLKKDYKIGVMEADIDSDVDAINVVASAICELEKTGMSFLVVSHYARLYELINPTRAAIMINGRIVLEGDTTLINRIDKEGYEWLKKEHGIEIKKEETTMNQVTIGTCAVKQIIK